MTLLWACLAALLPLVLGACSCADDTEAKPREWTVEEVNGISPATFALDGEVQESEPSVDLFSLFNFIPTPHNTYKIYYKESETFYHGSGRIGEAVFRDSVIIGYPMCAFSYKGKAFLMSQFPLYAPDRYGDKLVSYNFFLYILHKGELRELACSRSGKGLLFHDTRPRYAWAIPYTDKALWLDVLHKLRFAEPQLNFFAAAWYYNVTDTCVTHLEDTEWERRRALSRELGYVNEDEAEEFREIREQDKACAIREMTRLAEYLENAMATQAAATFAPDLPALMKKGYLISPDDEARTPSFDAFYGFDHGGFHTRSYFHAPELQALRIRLRNGWQSLLDQAARGEISLSPELTRMYQERIDELNEYIEACAQRN